MWLNGYSAAVGRNKKLWSRAGISVAFSQLKKTIFTASKSFLFTIDIVFL